MLKINLKKIAEALIPSFYEAGKESIRLSGKNLKITIKKDKITFLRRLPAGCRR